MIRLGRVLHVSSNKKIIVKLENLPKLGETVINEDLKVVGEVSDIFGPASSPYAAVNPKISKLDNLVGKVLYVLPSKKRREKK